MAKNQRIVDLLNSALEDEHQAYVQYLSHAEMVSGKDCEPIMARLKEIASDEAKHQEMFRTLIGDYLFGVRAWEYRKQRPLRAWMRF